MMRSMYSGVSGLRVHQTKMDVIGNNIANVNTVGFKGSKVTFQEVFYQTLRGAGSPQGGRGGTNPQQIGLGVNLASMNVVHSQGSTQTTNAKTDLMIDGNGYFVLSNDVNSQNRYYTRAGNFSEDKFGYLVAPNGYKVLGDDMKPIQINRSQTKAATPTSELEIKGNINVSDSEYETTVDVYDSLGDVHTLTIKFSNFESITTPINGSLRKIEILDEDNNHLFGESGGNERYIAFDTSGKFNQILEDDKSTQVTTETITLSAPGAEDISIDITDEVFLDNDNEPIFTQQSNTSDAKGVALDGNAAGTIDDYSISPKGEVIGTFTNGERKILARIGLADFDNPPGLLKVGGNMFIDTPNSGTPKYGAPATGSFGDLTPMSLEMSNIDLSQEFTDMITTQRGFQANSRIITTTDEMLQELVNLKR